MKPVSIYGNDHNAWTEANGQI